MRSSGPGPSSAGDLAPRVLLWAVGFLLAVGPAWAGVEPHAFMKKEEACPRCHSSIPVRPGGGFVKDIVSLCQECHQAGEGMDHPVDIRPGLMGMSPLPLDEEGTMTCATCHDPHTPAEGVIPYVKPSISQRLKRIFAQGNFPTYLLRIPNDKGQLCALCHSLEKLAGTEFREPEDLLDRYVGSETCGGCHEERYRAWSLTIHSRTLGVPAKDPGALLSTPGPDQGFAREDLVLTVGRHWTQRFVVRRGERLMVAKEVWNVPDGKWAGAYWKELPWDTLCAGCHITGYDPFRERYVELGIGCEACHGPGATHALGQDPKDIVNPARLGAVEAEAICASCHTHGHDRTGEYRFPVGYFPGRDLSRYFRGLIAKPGQDARSFKGDGSLADRIRSFRFWRDRFLLAKGVTCVLCKSFRAEETAEAGEDDPGATFTLAEYCLTCHLEMRKGDQHHSLFRIEQSNCLNCHEPLRDRRGAPSIHDHMFLFSAV